MPTAEEYIKWLKGQEGGEWTYVNGKRKTLIDPVTGNLLPYKDSRGNWTLGHGRVINKGLSKKGFEGGVSPEEAERWLREDYNEARRAARRAVGDKAWDQLDERRKLLLTDYSFNLGPNFNKRRFKKYGDKPGEKSGRGFPTFTAGVLAGDEQVMFDEFERTGLPYRNQGIIDLFGLADQTPPPAPVQTEAVYGPQMPSEAVYGPQMPSSIDKALPGGRTFK